MVVLERISAIIYLRFWCTIAVLDVEVVERVLVLVVWEVECFSTEVVGVYGRYLVELSV